MKILLDMNVSPRWKTVFEANHFVALHWLECGAPNATDNELMAFAYKNGYVIFTHDLDFGQLLAKTNAVGPSVIQLRMGVLKPEISCDMIINFLRQFNQLLEAGSLITIDPKRNRVRALPLNISNDESVA